MPVKSLTLLCLLALATQANSQGAVPAGQPLHAVRSAAVAALRRQLDSSMTGVIFEAAELDPRLRLTACPTPLAVNATLPRGTQSRTMVRVACKGTVFWSVNVPVDIHRKTDVLVMRRAVGRGENISAADVLAQSRLIPGLTSPYVTRPADLAGRLTRRPIPEGTAVTADALDAALLIHRGQSVVLAARAGGLEVRAPGVALADAAAEQRVRVRNLNSLKVIEGVADTAGVVRVNL